MAIEFLHSVMTPKPPPSGSPAAIPRETEQTQVMLVLDLLLDVAAAAGAWQSERLFDYLEGSAS